MSSRVHHEVRHVAITEVKVMLSGNARVVVTIRIVNAERVVSICEGRRVVGLARVVVDDLEAKFRVVAWIRGELSNLVVVICMDDG